MRIPHPFYFLRILHLLAGGDGAWLEQHSAPHGLVKLGIDTDGIKPESLILHPGKGKGYAVVGQYAYPLLSEHIESVQALRVLDLFLKHVPVHIILSYKEIGYGHRVVLDVGGPHIQQPGHLIQCADKNGIAAVLAQGLAQPFQLLLTALPRPYAEDRRLRYARPVLPQHAQKVRHAYHIEAFAKILHRFGALAEGIQGYHGFGVELHLQPFGNQHFLRHTGLMEHRPGAFKLLARLDEVAGVGP